jgi:hypothetical protein
MLKILHITKIAVSDSMLYLLVFYLSYIVKKHLEWIFSKHFKFSGRVYICYLPVKEVYLWQPKMVAWHCIN